MSRWFRHYAGMMRDEKLVRVAVRAKQPVERVVWVWGAILESAAELNDGGRYEFDAGEAAYFLRCDVDCVDAVLAELGGAGRLSEGVVARWGDRQYSSDGAAERQRRYRERKSQSALHQRDDKRNGDASVTSRDGAVTPQETETDTYPVASATDAAASNPRDALWREGVSSLKDMTGKTEPAARTLIGKWLATSKDDCALVLAKIRTARDERIVDSVAWITAALKPPEKPPPEPRNAGERALLKLQAGYPHEPTDTAQGRLEAGDGRRQVEGIGHARDFAVAQGAFGRS